MTKYFTILFLCSIAQVSFAQLYAEVGATGQFLHIARNESPGLGAMAELISLSGGDPNTTLPKIIRSKIIAPRISVGYRLPFDDFSVHVVAGTSQDFGNTLKGACFNAKVRAYKTWKGGLTAGGEFAFDNQRSETIINNSNITPKVRGLLNQISSEINLLGSGTTQNMQLNAIIGWEKTHDEFEFSIFGLVGMVGNAMGIQADFRVRYYFSER